MAAGKTVPNFIPPVGQSPLQDQKGAAGSAEGGVFSRKQCLGSHLVLRDTAWEGEKLEVIILS